MVAAFVGTLLSPHVFSLGGYHALYFVRLACVVVALAYWLRYIKSPRELGITVKEDGEEDDTKDKKTDEEDDKSVKGKVGEEGNCYQ